jgi:flagellin-specific chaperone FliS
MGRVAAAQDDTAQALKHLQQAKAIFEACRTYLEVGRTAYYCAQVWLNMADATKAHARLVEAQDIFEQLGAAPDLLRTEEALSSLAIPVSA